MDPLLAGHCSERVVLLWLLPLTEVEITEAEYTEPFPTSPGISSGVTYETDEEDHLPHAANEQLESLLDRINSALA